MSESLLMLSETADRLFADLAALEDQSFAAAWPQLAEAGFPGLLVPEPDGGFGGDWQDAFAVLRLAGFHALAAPLAETVIASAACAEAGWPALEGLVTHASRVEGELSEGRFTGRLIAVPWGHHAEAVVAAIGGTLIRLNAVDAVAIDRSSNLAGESRDGLRFDGALAETAPATTNLFDLCALARVCQIAGALDAALALSIQHANDRVQFGKPIAKFQAVQQALAVFAEEAAAVNCAGQAAARRADQGEAPTWLPASAPPSPTRSTALSDSPWSIGCTASPAGSPPGARSSAMTGSGPAAWAPGSPPRARIASGPLSPNVQTPPRRRACPIPSSSRPPAHLSARPSAGPSTTFTAPPSAGR
jgi:acyl-CoA dehydrogenase